MFDDEDFVLVSRQGLEPMLIFEPTPGKIPYRIIFFSEEKNCVFPACQMTSKILWRGHKN